MTERIPPYGEKTKATARLARVFEAAGCQTQLELAAVLEISQSSISDAKRRGSIPSDWLIKLLCLRGINPIWIMEGMGPKFLTPCDDTAELQRIPNQLHEVFSSVPDEAITLRHILRCFSIKDLSAELHRRKEK